MNSAEKAKQESNQISFEKLLAFFAGLAFSIGLGRKFYFTGEDPFDERLFVFLYLVTALWFVFFKSACSFKVFLRKYIPISIVALVSITIVLAVLPPLYLPLLLVAPLSLFIFLYLFNLFFSDDSVLQRQLGSSYFSKAFLRPILGFLFGFICFEIYANVNQLKEFKKPAECVCKETNR